MHFPPDSNVVIFLFRFLQFKTKIRAGFQAADPESGPQRRVSDGIPGATKEGLAEACVLTFPRNM